MMTSTYHSGIYCDKTISYEPLLIKDVLLVLAMVMFEKIQVLSSEETTDTKTILQSTLDESLSNMFY